MVFTLDFPDDVCFFFIVLHSPLGKLGFTLKAGNDQPLKWLVIPIPWFYLDWIKVEPCVFRSPE